MKIKFSLKGVKRLEQKFRDAEAKTYSKAEEITIDNALSIMAESEQLVPVQTGTLKKSAFVEEPKKGFVRIGYGQGAKQYNESKGSWSDEYMVVVHERLDVVHENGQAKFFEIPLRRYQEWGPERYEREIKAVLRRIR